MAETFNVRLKDGSGNVLHPETDWSVVQNKPSIYDKAYKLKKPNFLVTPILGSGLERKATLVSFGLIEIQPSLKLLPIIHSFYIVVGSYISKTTTSGITETSSQTLYYLAPTDNDVVWKKANIEYSEMIGSYSYKEGSTTFTVSLHSLLD